MYPVDTKYAHTINLIRGKGWISLNDLRFSSLSFEFVYGYFGIRLSDMKNIIQSGRSSKIKCFHASVYDFKHLILCVWQKFVNMFTFYPRIIFRFSNYFVMLSLRYLNFESYFTSTSTL